MKAYSTLDQGLGFGGLPQDAFDEIGESTVESAGYANSFEVFVDATAAESPV